MPRGLAANPSGIAGTAVATFTAVLAGGRVPAWVDVLLVVLALALIGYWFLAIILL